MASSLSGSGTIGPFTATGSGILQTNFLENITFQFIATAITSGNGVLTVLGSNDGVTYTAISFLDPTPSNTNAQTPTRLTSKTLSSNTSAVGSIENAWKFQFIKFSVAVTTDGSYSVQVHCDKKGM